MDVFGSVWENHTEKIRDGFNRIKSDDVCVLCGDISWGMTLEESLEDFRFIDSLPGKKILLKGNHDYWWSTVGKTKAFFAENNLYSMDILNNNCFFYNDYAICGTRGWFYEEETGTEHDKKIRNRELLRLASSFKAGGGAEKLCFFHYPPVYRDYTCSDFLRLMAENGVKRCCYGHLHGIGHKFATEGNYEGIEYALVSADWLDFKPLKILE